MFGKPPQSASSHGTQRPAAADVARIEGGGLVQLIVTDLAPLNYFLFLNDKAVPQMDVESISIAIQAPSKDSRDANVRATLSRYVNNVTGEKSLQRTELFPCTFEIVALGRRISITAMNANSLEGIWIDLGLRANGSGSDVKGAQELVFLLTEDILHAKLTWDDGVTEDLLPQ